MISSLTSQQFSKLISEDRGYQLFFKLMFSYLMTQLKVMRQLNKDAQQCLNTCQHYLKVIQNQQIFITHLLIIFTNQRKCLLMINCFTVALFFLPIYQTNHFQN